MPSGVYGIKRCGSETREIGDICSDKGNGETKRILAFLGNVELVLREIHRSHGCSKSRKCEDNLIVAASEYADALTR